MQGQPAAAVPELPRPAAAEVNDGGHPEGLVGCQPRHGCAPGKDEARPGIAEGLIAGHGNDQNHRLVVGELVVREVRERTWPLGSRPDDDYALYGDQHDHRPNREGPAPMGYRCLADCVRDLASTGQLVTIEAEVDPWLEAAAIQRRVYQAGGPAVFFRRLKGTSFPAVSNLFGTLERARFLFRDSLEAVRRLVELKVDPGDGGQAPVALSRGPTHALAAQAATRPPRPGPGSSDHDR